MIKNIKTPKDIITYMDEKIKYGWVGIDGIKRINQMESFRTNYRTMSIEDMLFYGVGTCIEQVYLMHILLDSLNIENKMFCTRMYEDESFNDKDAPERMHCFLLFYLDNKVFQIEHSDPEKIGIHEFESEEDAIIFLENRYEKMTEEDYKRKNKPIIKEDLKRITTEFYEVKEGLNYKEFNLYINDLDEYKNIK